MFLDSVLITKTPTFKSKLDHVFTEQLLFNPMQLF